MSEKFIISNNKRIAKNTAILYLRMIFILCIGLFTSRVVLNALGVEDYGIYNVVGGFVSFFAFLNGAMSTATQRFLTFELASGTLESQRRTFSTALIIHFILAIIIFILAETVGLWFVCNKLVIPEIRFTAALWVYQLSIATCIFSVISLPYNAMIIAHERMSAFAYISIMDATLKLIIVYCLIISPWDKLILYAILLFVVGVLDRLIYGFYCSKHFPEARFVCYFDKTLLKKMNNIAGWSLFGNVAGIGYTQGLNVLLNMFFGPAINASRGIAVTVQGVVSGFVSNFQMALNPQITKSYAVNDLDRMHKLIYVSSKFSFLLLFLLVLPIIIEAKQILIIWLKLVPEYSVTFLRFTLCIMLIETLANPLMIASQATGKVKVYQSIVGGTLLMIVPIAYFVLKLGGNPTSVFIVHLIVAILAQLFRLYIISRQIQMPLNKYFERVVYRIIFVCIAAVIPVYLLFSFIPDTIVYHLTVIFVTFLITFIVIVTVGLTKNERMTVFSKIDLIIKSKLKHGK